jgi:hypothetical protein
MTGVMAEMDLLLISLVGVCCLVSLFNWRQGLYLGIILDVLRDPVRKLTTGEPAWMTQVMVPVWAAILVGCLTQKATVARDLRRFFPGVRKGVLVLCASLIPGLAMSMLLYQNGWLVAAIGGVSYLGPLAGLLIGACLAMEKQDVFRFLRLYIIVNSLAFVGSQAEYFRLDWVGLGGMAGVEWIRHIPGVQVRMISGFFRSPDIAGFHAANVIVFAALMAIPKFRGDRVRPLWLMFAAWAVAVVFLAGRRKMLAIPLVFLFVFVGVNAIRKQRNAGRSISFLLMSVIMLGAGVTYVLSGETELDQHTAYYSTILGDAIPKLYDSSFGQSIETVRQSGILGSGLGVASQGAQHTGIDRKGVWQEDGTSRLFKELGVVGVILFAFALLLFAGEFRRALRGSLSDPVRAFFQSAGLAIAGGNLAAFVISHQHISGDAANGLLPLLFLGGVLGHSLADIRSRQVRSPGIVDARILTLRSIATVPPVRPH